MKNRLKQIRETLGYSQTQFAKLIPMDRSTYCRAEKGSREMADYYVELIGLKFGVNKTWLLTGEGEMFATPEPSEEESEERSDPEREAAEKYLIEKIQRLPEDCKKDVLKFCLRLLKAESKNF